MDRVTLRAWRVANLVGWWFVGAAIYNVGGVLAERVLLRKLGNVNVEWKVQVALTLVALFAAATAGWVVGRHVYRAPGTVGAATVLLPGVLFILLSSALSSSVGALVGALVVLVFSALPAAVATIAARIAWRRRPSALRVGSGAHVVNPAIRNLDDASGGISDPPARPVT